MGGGWSGGKGIMGKKDVWSKNEEDKKGKKQGNRSNLNGGVSTMQGLMGKGAWGLSHHQMSELWPTMRRPLEVN